MYILEVFSKSLFTCRHYMCVYVYILFRYDIRCISGICNRLINKQLNHLICIILLVLVGFAKNQAVRQSSGRFLCFQDAVSVCVCV